MKICLLNGNPDSSNIGFEEKLNEIFYSYNNSSNLKSFELKNLKIKPCTGCFCCWVKTPGECVVPDDTIKIREAAINSDLLVFASPLIMGFTSSILKHVQDKLIPILMPYIELVDNECHHEKRYDHYPKVGVLYYPMEDTDDDDINITHRIYKRFVINFKTELLFFENINNIEDLSNAVNID